MGGGKRLITRRLDAARAALAAAEGEHRERATRQVVVGLDATEPGDIEITVTYVVWGASWQPLYDVRLVEEQVTLGYLASVQQTSGEDWPAVPADPVHRTARGDRNPARSRPLVRGSAATDRGPARDAARWRCRLPPGV